MLKWWVKYPNVGFVDGVCECSGDYTGVRGEHYRHRDHQVDDECDLASFGVMA